MGHGGNDAQKTMGIIWLLLIANGVTTEDHLPTWVVMSCFLAIGVGTMFGGWRIVKTMGQRITKLKPVGGFAAECAGSITLFMATHFGHPGVHHAHHHRRHHRRGHDARHFRGALGCGRQHRDRVDHHSSRRRRHRRAGVVARAASSCQSAESGCSGPGVLSPTCTAGRARNASSTRFTCRELRRSPRDRPR